MSEPKRSLMLFGFCKRGHPRTEETTFERKATIRRKSGWTRTYLVRECRICHSQRNTKTKINHNSTSKWKRFMERAAIADTHAKRGDVQQAPSLMSGGGAEGNRTEASLYSLKDVG